MQIKISKEQFDILKDAALANHSLHLIHLNKITHNDCWLEVSEDELYELHECCADYLPLVGFDQNYNINRSGQLLESLIDKFHEYLEN